MAVFSELEVWIDPLARSGAENMAVDEILHTNAGELPLLRIYQWSHAAVTFGYFEKLSDAMREFPGEGIEYVRRWTGGGIVDHRLDLTYSLSIPRGHPLEQQRGNTSYAVIHQALVKSMQACGVECELTKGGSDSKDRACFVKPVPFDIIGSRGQKLAGAGQKRSRYGLLHQGSVQGVTDSEAWQNALIQSLATNVKEKDITELGDVSKVVRARYGNSAWTRKRL
jgi:lipoate-protein ligase A